jgi:GNAT superfamily N-acetyltransferase
MTTHNGGMSSSVTSITIRPAAAQDALAIAEIWESAWRDAHLGNVPDSLVDIRTADSFRERAAARVPETSVAVVDGVVIGFVTLEEDELEQLFVDRAHRGTGVADALMADAERRLGEAGHRQVWLAVVSGNARARRFYERSGWKDEGPFEYFADGPDGPITVAAHRYVKAPLQTAADKPKRAG